MSKVTIKPLANVQKKVLEAYSKALTTNQIAKSINKTEKYISVVFAELFRRYADHIDFTGKTTPEKKQLLLDFVRKNNLIDNNIILPSECFNPSPVIFNCQNTAIPAQDKLNISPETKQKLNKITSEIQQKYVKPNYDEFFNAKESKINAELDELHAKTNKLLNKLEMLLELRQEFQGFGA